MHFQIIVCVTQFFEEFTEFLPNRYGKIEFKQTGKLVGYVTKAQIIWLNKLLHWIGYDHTRSSSSFNLLDLANSSVAERQCPFAQILGYVDLSSLYALSTARKRSKQLVDGWMKRHSEGRGVFSNTYEFESDGNGLDQRLVERYGIISQARHLIFDTVGDVCDYTYLDRFGLFELSRLFPKLEELEMKWKSIVGYRRNGESLYFRHLKKFTFKFSEFGLEAIRAIFNNSESELIPTNIKKSTQ